MGHKGELVVFVEDVRDIALRIKSDLEELDNLILKLKQDLIEEKLDIESVKERITEIRQNIGKIKQEEEASLDHADRAHSILEKLDALVDKCIDRE